MKFYFSLPVWGEKYITFFTTYTLKLLLADGNIPFLARTQNTDIHFFLYCEEQDICRLTDHPLIAKLSSFCELHFVDLDKFEQWSESRNKYSKMNAAHMHTLNKSVEQEAFYVPLVADSVISSAFYQYCFEKIVQGYEAVLTRAFRMDEKKFENHIAETNTDHGGSIPLDADRVCDHIFELLHKEEYFDNVYSPQRKSFSKNRLNWIDEGQSIITRNVRYFPSVSKVSSEFEGCVTVDDGTILLDFRNKLDKLFIVKDPRECFSGSLADDSDIFDTISSPFSHVEISKFLSEHIDPFFLYFFSQPIELVVNRRSEAFVERAEQDYSLVMEGYELYVEQKKALARLSDFESSNKLPAWCFSVDFLNTVVRRFNGILADEKALYIYGAGEHTKVLLYSSPCYSNILGIIDKDTKKHGTRMFGYPVVSVKSMMQSSAPIVISSQAFEREICAELTACVSESTKIYKLYD